MKLSIRNTFPCDAETLWHIFNEDPEFDRRLEEQSGVSRVVTDRRDEGGVRTWRLRCTSKKELPGFMASALGAKHLVYDQTSRFDPARNELVWEVLPTLLSERVTAKGTTRVIPGDGECTRIVEGEISVRLPLVGGRIEKKLMEEIEASYVRAAAIANALIDERDA
jgi:hypothetical protein